MDDKKRLNLVDVQPSTHSWLIKKANEEGMNIKDYAGVLLDLVCMNDWQPPIDDKAPLHAQGYWAFVQIMNQRRMREYAYAAAAAYKEEPSDETAEWLARLCEAAGLNYDSLISIVDNDPFSSLVINAKGNDSKFGQCMQWLPQELLEAGGQLPYSEIQARAEKRGFSMSMVGRVKKAINADSETPSIVSERQSYGWDWKVASKDGEEPFDKEALKQALSDAPF